VKKEPLYSTIFLLLAVGLSFASLASPAIAQRITFRFEGEYDPGLVPPPPYAIDVGTPILGEFSYDLASVDTAVSDDDQGFYPQVEPYQLKFQIGDSIFFQTDQYGFRGYLVWIENDASNPLPTRDIIRISSRDSELAASYGIDDVSANLTLQDLTAQAFEGDALPTDLGGFDLDALGAGWLFLNGTNYEGDWAISVFAHRFRIDSVERVAGQVLSVSTDIKPGSDRNAINPLSRGVVPVAILGSEDFHVADIDVTTLAFGPDYASPTRIVGRHRDDVNADGFSDLLAHFRTEDTGIAISDTQACLTGETFDRIPFEGCDAIRAVPGGRGLRP
jgi:hypothetical protein